jgi:hypothetical protein
VFCGDAHRMVALAPDVNPKDGVASATVDLGGSPEFAVADGRGKVISRTRTRLPSSIRNR